MVFLHLNLIRFASFTLKNSIFGYFSSKNSMFGQFLIENSVYNHVYIKECFFWTFLHSKTSFLYIFTSQNLILGSFCVETRYFRVFSIKNVIFKSMVNENHLTNIRAFIVSSQYAWKISFIVSQRVPPGIISLIFVDEQFVRCARRLEES